MSKRVEDFFKANNYDLKVMYSAKSSATVALAAIAFSTLPEKIGKTLSFKVGEENIVIVTSGILKVDNQKYKSTFKTKAKMMSSEEANELLGYPIGGVCPFDLEGRAKVYLDESLKKFEFIYPAGGSTNSAVKINPKYLEEVTNGTWIDVCKE